jgi:hypothetical protein
VRRIRMINSEIKAEMYICSYPRELRSKKKRIRNKWRKKYRKHVGTVQSINDTGIHENTAITSIGRMFTSE